MEQMAGFDFQALVVRKGEGKRGFTRSVELRNSDDLPPGEVLIRVLYSSLNYKDALSADGNRGVTRNYPHTPGIDCAGIVIQSDSDDLQPGETVIVSGYDLGMNTAGGFGQYIRVPAAWVLSMPSGLSARQCMEIGTAGFTAAQCVDRLLSHGLQKNDGPVLVTGATGGVGSIAVMLLAQLGFSVTAVSGKTSGFDFLQEVGADQVLERKRFVGSSGSKMLLRERWAGVVDTVGGEILATAVKGASYGSMVTSCGNAASGELSLNVYPFILRGVCLQGIDSAACSMNRRREVWCKLADDWRLPHLDSLCTTIGLAELDATIAAMLEGRISGRFVVQLWDEEDES
jgi:putative YhdH/YhfP family quinone oxidoreductase